jgi:hypothetical protein
MAERIDQGEERSKQEFLNDWRDEAVLIEQTLNHQLDL